MLGGGKGDAEIREYGGSLRGDDDQKQQMVVRFETRRAAQLAAAAATRDNTGLGLSYAQSNGSFYNGSIAGGSWFPDLIQSAVTLGATLKSTAIGSEEKSIE